MACFHGCFAGLRRNGDRSETTDGTAAPALRILTANDIYRCSAWIADVMKSFWGGQLWNSKQLGDDRFKKQKSPVVCGVFNPYILESFFEVLWFCYDFVLRAILGLKESVQLYSCFWLARSKFPWTTPSRKMCNFIEPSRPWKSLPPLLCPASVEHEPPWMIFKKKCFWRSPLFRKGFNRKKGETYRLISWITRRSDGWNLASFSWAACLSSMASLRRVHLFGENQFFLAICAAHWDNISK